jgi:hypothetical protein
MSVARPTQQPANDGAHNRGCEQKHPNLKSNLDHDLSNTQEAFVSPDSVKYGRA